MCVGGVVFDQQHAPGGSGGEGEVQGQLQLFSAGRTFQKKQTSMTGRNSSGSSSSGSKSVSGVVGTPQLSLGGHGY
jgi:hypothetical protein